MDVARAAELAVAVTRAQAGQDLSVAVLKQKQQQDQAVAQIVQQAVDQTKAAAGSAADGHTVDIVV